MKLYFRHQDQSMEDRVYSSLRQCMEQWTCPTKDATIGRQRDELLGLFCSQAREEEAGLASWREETAGFASTPFALGRVLPLSVALVPSSTISIDVVIVRRAEAHTLAPSYLVLDLFLVTPLTSAVLISTPGVRLYSYVIESIFASFLPAFCAMTSLILMTLLTFRNFGFHYVFSEPSTSLVNGMDDFSSISYFFNVASKGTGTCSKNNLNLYISR